jgi:hypothetical protein
VDISVDVPTVEFDSVVFKGDVVVVDVGVVVVVLAFVTGNGVKVVAVFGSRKNEVRLTLLAVEGVLIKVLAMEGVVIKVLAMEGVVNKVLLAFAEEFKFGRIKVVWAFSSIAIGKVELSSESITDTLLVKF